jgi:hypothetical protein
MEEFASTLSSAVYCADPIHQSIISIIIIVKVE